MLSKLFTKYPIMKGMMSYAIIWPTGSLIQQTIAKEEHYDFKKAARFGIFATLFVAPSLYGWIRLTSAMWPQTNFRSGLTKAIVEQFSYGPLASTSFFYGMKKLEGKSHKEAKNEVKEKFYPTWRVGVCYWPVMQTINFSIIPERNRVPFVSLCSLVWTIFLSYMHKLETSGGTSVISLKN